MKIFTLVQAFIFSALLFSGDTTYFKLTEFQISNGPHYYSCDIPIEKFCAYPTDIASYIEIQNRKFGPKVKSDDRAYFLTQNDIKVSAFFEEETLNEISMMNKDFKPLCFKAYMCVEKINISVFAKEDLYNLYDLQILR